METLTRTSPDFLDAIHGAEIDAPELCKDQQTGKERPFVIEIGLQLEKAKRFEDFFNYKYSSKIFIFDTITERNKFLNKNPHLKN